MPLKSQCDTHDASAYIGAELVTACRTIIDELRAARARVRDQQLPARAVTLPSTATDGSRPRPRPNAATNASVSNTPSEPGAAERQREGRKAKRRARSSEPSTSDRLLYASASVYERAVAQGMREASEDPLWMHLMRPRCPTGAKASRGPQSVAKPGATSPPLAAGATSPRRVVCVKPANAVDSPTVGDRVQVQSFGSGILRWVGVMNFQVGANAVKGCLAFFLGQRCDPAPLLSPVLFVNPASTARASSVGMSL